MWGVCLGIGENVVPPLLMPPDALVTGVLHSSVAMRPTGTTVVTSKSESRFSIESFENITLITKYKALSKCAASHM
jgi:hypothetical protein